MRIRFKHQKFQADAAKAVVDVFAGQPYLTPSYMMDRGDGTFQMTQEHFAEEYGKKIRYFIYNSSQLTEIDRFASDSSINVMIINSQAFNARGKDAAGFT